MDRRSIEHWVDEWRDKLSHSGNLEAQLSQHEDWTEKGYYNQCYIGVVDEVILAAIEVLDE